MSKRYRKEMKMQSSSPRVQIGALRLARRDSWNSDQTYPARRLINASRPKPASGKLSLDERVHALRVQNKRLRAALELLRPYLSRAAYRSAKSRIKSVARPLSAPRDAAVLRKTLLSAVKCLPRKKRGQPARWVNDRFTEKSKVSLDVLARSENRLQNLPRLMPGPAAQTQLLAAFVKPGLKQAFKKARDARRKAKERKTPRDFHKWRIWSKRLFLQLDLLHKAGVKVNPKLTKKLDCLQHRLGDHRDLILAENLEEAPARLHREIKRERRKLERKLLRQKQRCFHEKPKRAVNRLIKG